MEKVLGVGNALVDILTKLDSDQLLAELSLPKGSMQLVTVDQSEVIKEKTSHLEKTMASGGSAANTISGLAKLGAKTSFVGKIGIDKIGDAFLDDLIEAKIQPQLIQCEEPSGFSNALVSPDSERTMATYLGAAMTLSAEEIREDMFTKFDYLYVEGYLVLNHDLLKEILTLAKKNRLTVALDLASYNVVEDNLDFLKEIISDYVDIVFANEEEAKAFTGKEAEEALDIISEMTEIAVVKVGPKGSFIKCKGETCKVGVTNHTRRDTTGAGDLYAAGFIYGLLKEYDLETCGKIGAILSGNVIEFIGAKMDDERWKSIIKDVEAFEED